MGACSFSIRYLAGDILRSSREATQKLASYGLGFGSSPARCHILRYPTGNVIRAGRRVLSTCWMASQARNPNFVQQLPGRVSPYFMGLIWFRLLGRRSSDRSKTRVRFPPAPPFFTDLSMSKTAPIPILDRTVKECGSARYYGGCCNSESPYLQIRDRLSVWGWEPLNLDFSLSFAIISLCLKNTV
jgi:hypothetical protein